MASSNNLTIPKSSTSQNSAGRKPGNKVSELSVCHLYWDRAVSVREAYGAVRGLLLALDTMIIGPEWTKESGEEKGFYARVVFDNLEMPTNCEFWCSLESNGSQTFDIPLKQFKLLWQIISYGGHAKLVQRVASPEAYEKMKSGEAYRTRGDVITLGFGDDDLNSGLDHWTEHRACEVCKPRNAGESR